MTDRFTIVARLPEIAALLELDAMAEAGNAVIEISGDPVDAHSTGNLDFLRTAVTLARRGGVRAEEVLNARPTAAFLRGLSSEDGRPDRAQRARRARLHAP